MTHHGMLKGISPRAIVGDGALTRRLAGFRTYRLVAVHHDASRENLGEILSHPEVWQLARLSWGCDTSAAWLEIVCEQNGNTVIPLFCDMPRPEPAGVGFDPED